MAEPHINGVKIDWNDMIFLNQALKEHQIQAAQKNISDKEKSHLNTLISTFNYRIQQLLLDREKSYVKKRQ